LSSGGGNYGGTLYNCTLTGNSAGGSGGGNCDGTLYNCTLTGNSAQFGGGNDGGTLYNCTLTGNSAASGGGNLDGTLYNCTLTGNSAASGGGNYGGTLYNCTIVENTATSTGGGTRRGTLYNCILYNNMPSDWWHLWIEPEPYFAYCRIDRNPGGIGNITSLPSFVAPGDYHLASNSPCINAGSNGYVNVAADLDGHPRIVGGMVDMGAYESGFTGCFITNGIANGSDVLLEWTAFPMWESTVQYSTNLVTMPFTDLSAPMPYPANSYTDLVHGAESECFYKVLIQP